MGTLSAGKLHYLHMGGLSLNSEVMIAGCLDNTYSESDMMTSGFLLVTLY